MPRLKRHKPSLTLDAAFKMTGATTICTSNGFLIDGVLPVNNKRVLIMEEDVHKHVAEKNFLRTVNRLLKTK